MIRSLYGFVVRLQPAKYIKHPFWRWASDSYKEVIACIENHEFYKNYDISTLKNGDCLKILPNVHSYYNEVVHLEDVDIIVSTLWSRIASKYAYYIQQVVSDFRRILYDGELLTFAEFNNEHEKCLEFIKSALAESKAAKKIIVTHHVPSYKMQCPEFKDSLANSAFIVELEDFIKNSDIDYWIYGHSHYNVDVQIGKTRCVSNQLGYISHNEHKSFDAGKIFEV